MLKVIDKKKTKKTNVFKKFWAKPKFNAYRNLRSSPRLKLFKNVKKIALLPNLITTFGLTCGLFAIFKINMIEVGEINYHTLLIITGFLLLAAFADLLDGAVARVLKAESAFGSFFDSLADSISFGVAPSVIVLKSLSVPQGTNQAFLITTATIIFSICGVLRLARFNVSTLDAKNDETLALEQKKHFTGLPIPAAAAACVSLNLFLFSDELNELFSVSQINRMWILSIALTLLGYCMISRWKFPNVKSLDLRVATFKSVFLTALGAVIIFFGILHFFAFVLFLLSWGYVCIAWTFAIIRKIVGRTSKTLDEYEPEPDEFNEIY